VPVSSCPDTTQEGANLTDILLAICLVLGVLAYLDTRRRHNELIDLLNDLATMLGELFENKE